VRRTAATAILGFGPVAMAEAAPPPKPKKEDAAAAKKDAAAAKKDAADPSVAAATAPAKPVTEWDTAVAYFRDAENTGWTSDKCSTAADKFQSANKGKRAEGYFNAGVAMERCGRTNDAERLYRKALDVNPTHGPSLANLGEIAYKAGKYQDAQNYFDQAVNADGGKLEVSAAPTNRAEIANHQLGQ